MSLFSRHRRRVTIGIAAALFLLCAVAIIVVNNATQTKIFWTSQQTQLSMLTERCQFEVQEWIEQKELLLDTLTGELRQEAFTTRDECETQLKYFVSLDDEILSCYAGFEDLHVYVSIPFDDPTFDPRTRDWYKAAIAAGGDLAITEPYIDLLTGELIVSISKKTTLEGMEAVVGMDVRLTDLNKAVRNLETSENGGAYLVSREGKVLTYSDEDLNPKIEEGTPAFTAAADVFSQVTVLDTGDNVQDEDITIQHIIDYDGEEKYEATAEIPYAGWTLGVNVPLSDYDSAVENVINAQIPLLVLAVAMSLLCLFIAFVLIRREKDLRKDQEQLMDELNKKNEQLSIMTNHDALTGVFSRRYLMAFLEKRLTKYNEQRPISILMFDLDHFKSVNDKYGHAVGDEVLVAVTKEISSMLRANDILARLGGEEFIGVLEGANAEQASIVAERIRKKVEAMLISGKIKITVSIGVIEATADETIDQLFDRVDVNLYRAKDSGRNRVVCERNDTAKKPSQA